jgi:hypothetical protein
MGMLYTVPFSAVAVTAQQDFFEITAASSSIVIIHQILLSQNTEVGDAQEEQLAILIKRGATTTGSGGSTVTPAPTEFGFGAAGFVAKTNNTTKATSGTIVTLLADNWNERSQWLHLPTPELRFVLSPSQRLTVELATTPADSVTVSGCLWAEQIGG